MPHISLDCPYCRTKRAAFEGGQFLQVTPGDDTRFIVLMQCRVCGNGVVAMFASASENQFFQWVQGKASMAPDYATLVRVFPPEPAPLAAPQHTPDNVGRFYLQGMDNVARNFDAAGVMFRKSLDAALKHLDPTGKGSLEKRINSLPEATGVTPAMKQWAHEIRHLGNDAAHEEDPFTEAETKSLQAFTELFLIYVFTLPGMLAARKAAAQDTTT